MACTKISVSGILLFTLNCLYMFSGIGFAVGWIIPLLMNPNQVQGDRRGFFQNTAYHDWYMLRILLTSGGLLLFCNAMLGCIASVKKKVWMLMTFSFILVLSIGLQIAGGLKNVTNRSASDMWSQKGFIDVMKTYWMNPQAPLAKVTDGFQVSLECCGFDNYRDWNVTTWKQRENIPQHAVLGFLPRSCCKERDRCKRLFDIYEKGCKKKIDSVLSSWISHVRAIHSMVAAIIMLEVIGLVISLQMINWINTNKRDEARLKAIYGPTRL